MISKGDKVCFITPPSLGKTVIRDYAGGLGFEADSGYILPPLDLMQFAACIEHDFDVALIDAQAENISADEVLERLKKLKTDLVIIELSVPTLLSDLDCAKRIAAQGITVVGKIHTQEESLLKIILEQRYVTKCIVAECEDNLTGILIGTDNRGTAALKGKTVAVHPKDFVTNLDVLPFPIRKLVLGNEYCYPKLGICTTILSSRGCPYPCGYYCPYPLTQGRQFRFRSSESIMQELLEIRKLGISRILFRDPVFSLRKDRVADICRGMMNSNMNLEWWCETRADLLPDDLIELMTQAGCKGINVGVESGDPCLRFSQLKRGVSDEVLLKVVTKAKSVGIKIAFLLMIGFPGETRHSVLQTAELLRKCRPFSIGVSFPVHHPQTQLEKDARAQGWIIVYDYLVTDGSTPVLAGPGLNSEEMIQGRDFIIRLFEHISAGEVAPEEAAFREMKDWANQTRRE